MPWTAQPSEALIDHVRSMLAVNPNLSPIQLMLDVTNNTNEWDAPGAERLPKDMRLVQIGWAMAIVDSRKPGAERLPMPAPPCGGEVPSSLASRVSARVVDWMQRVARHAVDERIHVLSLRASVWSTPNEAGIADIEVELDEENIDNLRGELATR